MRFAVDPWDPSYGAGIESEMPASEADVILDLEREIDDWAPISPGRVDGPDNLLFVDGVRRLEARTWITADDGTTEPGIFASYAAGCVRCNGTAEIVDISVGRGVYSPAHPLDPVETRTGTFVPTRTGDATTEALTLAVHQDMAEAEIRVAERARRSEAELIVLDGPIRKRGHIRDAVGLVKAHHVRYLPRSLEGVVDALVPGQRTPVFRIEAPPFGRASWYLRLPGPGGHPFASVVRCETSGALPTEELVELADTLSARLVRFASLPHKDPRAPQNLFPIAGLERELRHRLGDQRLVYRALRSASHPT